LKVVKSKFNSQRRVYKRSVIHHSLNSLKVEVDDGLRLIHPTWAVVITWSQRFGIWCGVPKHVLGHTRIIRVWGFRIHWMITD